MEEKLITHKVRIDKYLTAELAIPETMTAMDLKALMSKATRLFNLSEVPMEDGKSREKKSNVRKSAPRKHSDEFVQEVREFYKANGSKATKNKYHLTNGMFVNLIYRRKANP